ncbi:MAG: T9SS type A sorting domain-containing protein [Saprospiraceae bacterium]|nr:T9SS type A sorting domain-containing protein [Saprospiraceae bacterium]
MEHFKLFLATILLFVTNMYSFAQWGPVSSGTVEHLVDIHFPTNNIGYIVGENSTLLKTSDSGLNWEPLKLDTVMHINSVHFVNSDTGFIACNGKLLHTVDGGMNWTNANESENKSYNSVYFINDTIGFCGDDQGKILKTTDGGISWNEKTKNNDSWITDFYFSSQDTGFALSNEYSSSFFKTINGGESWLKIPVKPIFVFSVMTSLYFFNNNEGLIGGLYNPLMIKTNDSGNSWSISTLNHTLSCMSMDFFNDFEGVAVGFHGNIFNSTDRGVTWFRDDEAYSIKGNYTKVAFNANKKIGYIAGANGILLRNENLGLVGTNNPIQDKIITISPNPANQQLFLYTEQLQQVKIQLQDFTGKNVIIKELDLPGVLNVDFLLPGVYFALISKNDKIFEQHKVVIQQP